MRWLSKESVIRNSKKDAKNKIRMVQRKYMKER